MSITGYTMTPFGNQTLVEVTSGLSSPRIYWYLDGIYTGSSLELSQWFMLEPGDQAEVIAIDSTSDSFDPIANQPTAWPARRSITWTRSDDASAASYRVYQKLGAGSFVLIDDAPAIPGRWWYSVLTPRLTDLSSYTWEIRPVDAAGNEGTALVVGPELIVRRPDSPDFTVTYNSGPATVTIAAA